MPQTARAPAVRPASTLTLPSDLEIKIDRVLNAPRSLVWRAWTDPKLLPRWMGPAQYEMTTSEMDVRRGGKYRWVWAVDGNELVIRGHFVEVDAPSRLVTVEYMEPFPEPSHNTATFSEKAGKTTVSLVIKAPNKEARDAMLASGMKDGMDLGYIRLDGLLDELARNPSAGTGSTLTLPSDTEIRITRTFRASRAAVFRAWTDPALLPRWMNPPHCQMTKAEIDLRPGGRLHYTYTTPRGTMEQGGKFVEVKAPERLLFTESRGPQDPGWRTTVEFAEAAGTTTLTITHHMANVKARDEALASGMDKLWDHAWTQLDAHLQGSP